MYYCGGLLLHRRSLDTFYWCFIVINLQILTTKSLCLSPPGKMWVVVCESYWVRYHCDGSEQDCSISIANALWILQSCTKPSICFRAAYNVVLQWVLIYYVGKSVWHQFVLDLQCRWAALIWIKIQWWFHQLRKFSWGSLQSICLNACLAWQRSMQCFCRQMLPIWGHSSSYDIYDRIYCPL